MGDAFENTVGELSTFGSQFVSDVKRGRIPIGTLFKLLIGLLQTLGNVIIDVSVLMLDVFLGLIQV